MAEETTAGKRAWSLITGDTESPSDGALFRIFLLIALFAGIGLSVYTIYNNMEYIPPMAIVAERQAPTADIDRLNTMIRNLNAANDARIRSLEMASAAAAVGRYPFVAHRQTANIVDAPFDYQEMTLPPYVRVRGTLIIEGRSAAMLDIEGEPDGKIFRVGDRFADRKGRITRISQDRVTIIFENNEFTYTP